MEAQAAEVNPLQAADQDRVVTVGRAVTGKALVDTEAQAEVAVPVEVDHPAMDQLAEVALRAGTIVMGAADVGTVMTVRMKIGCFGRSSNLLS